MKRTKYTSEFKEEAVKQVLDKGCLVPDVAQRLGVAEGVLYMWVKKFKKADEPVASGDLKAMQAEMAKLKANTTAVCEPIKPIPPVIKIGRVMTKKPGKVVITKNLSNYRLQGGASL